MQRASWVRRAAVGAALAAVVPTVAGCSARYSYLSSSSTNSYLRVPKGWTVFDQNQILSSIGSTARYPYFVVFDANSKPSVAHTFAPTTQPWGAERVKDLSGSEMVSYSFDTLDNELIQVDQLLQSGTAQVRGRPQLLTRNGYRGVRQQIAVQDKGATVVFDEVGYVNTATTRSWSMVVGCSATCFDRNSATIDRLVQSWTVGH